jgi:hypothetical protein
LLPVVAQFDEVIPRGCGGWLRIHGKIPQALTSTR